MPLDLQRTPGGPRRTVAYLALGSNLADRLAALGRAAMALNASDGIAVIAKSPVFETDAVAAEPQPPYLNAVIRIDTRQTPQQLLQTCLAVERALGRVRPAGVHKAPRLIDIDLLLYGALVLQDAALIVPHPGLLERPFVRIPLAAVATPGLRHPITGAPLDQAAPDPGVRPFTAAW